VAVPARPCLCRSRPAVVRPPPCRGYVPAPAADPLRHTVVISRIRHTSQDAATKLHDGASYTSRRSRLELARRNFRHNDPARPPTGIGRPGSPPHPQGRTRRHRQHTGQPAWNRSPGAHSRGGNDAPLTQREAMIGAGRPPTDEQISQICARQLVSTRLAQTTQVRRFRFHSRVAVFDRSEVVRSGPCQLPAGRVGARPVSFSLISHNVRAVASSRAAADGSRRWRLT
jgi:hypothetical protein